MGGLTFNCRNRNNMTVEHFSKGNDMTLFAMEKNCRHPGHSDENDREDRVSSETGSCMICTSKNMLADLHEFTAEAERAGVVLSSFTKLAIDFIEDEIDEDVLAGFFLRRELQFRNDAVELANVKFEHNMEILGALNV